MLANGAEVEARTDQNVLVKWKQHRMPSGGRMCNEDTDAVGSWNTLSTCEEISGRNVIGCQVTFSIERVRHGSITVNAPDLGWGKCWVKMK